MSKASAVVVGNALCCVGRVRRSEECFRKRYLVDVSYKESMESHAGVDEMFSFVLVRCD